MNLTRRYLTGSSSIGILTAATHLHEHGLQPLRIAIAPKSALRGDTMMLDNGQVVTAGVPYRREAHG